MAPTAPALSVSTGYEPSGSILRFDHRSLSDDKDDKLAVHFFFFFSTLKPRVE